jgi:hypothetical protein
MDVTYSKFIFHNSYDNAETDKRKVTDVSPKADQSIIIIIFMIITIH